MKNHILYFCLFICGILPACSFSPHGAYEEDINPNIKNQNLDRLQINLSESSETIPLARETLFKYVIEAGKVNVKDVKVFFNNRLIVGAGSNVEYIFGLNPKGLSRGIYDLEIMVITNSGTGSLADAVGKENMTKLRTWKVAIDNDPPHAVQITSIKRTDGRLKVEWQKYDRINFYKYQVNCGSSNFDIFDQNVTEFYDPTYLGAARSFSVKVFTVNPGERESDLRQYNDSAPKFLSVEPLENHQLKISWQGTNYYKNLAYYAISVNRDIIDATKYQYSQDIARLGYKDTTYVMPAYFGLPISYRLHSYFKYPNDYVYSHGQYEERAKYTYGSSFPKHDAIQVHKKSGYLVSSYDNIIKVSNAAGNIINQKSYPSKINSFDIDQVQNRLAVIYYDGGYYKVDILDFSTLEPIEIIDTRSLDSSIGAIAFSAKGWLCFYSPVWSSKHNLIYHITSGEKYYLEETTIQQSTFSPSGKYMAVSTTRGAYVYTFQADGSISKNWLPGEKNNYWEQRRPFVFDPADEEKAYYIDNSNTTFSIVKQVNTADLSLISSRRVSSNSTTYPEDPVLLTIDPYTGYFGGSSSKWFFVYDFHADKMLEVVPKAKEARNLRLIDHTLYSPTGILLSLKR